MNFDYSPKVQELRKQVIAFMHEHVHRRGQTQSVARSDRVARMQLG